MKVDRKVTPSSINGVLELDIDEVEDGLAGLLSVEVTAQLLHGLCQHL